MSLSSINLVDPVAPTGDTLTPYDRAHYLLYGRLLDADIDGSDWQITALNILECDVSNDPEGAKLCFDSHLLRARWLVETGLDLLLEGGPQ